MSLLKLQREALNVVLNPIGQDSQWKILIFDTHCQNILSTLYKVGELREMCITLHLNINHKRERLHGVLAIYFLQPSQENIKKLQDDLQSDLYSQIIVNFCSPISEELIEQFAKSIAGTRAINKIAKVFEHNLDFTSLNHNLFTFNIQNSYLSLQTEKVAQHLHSLISTMRMQPIILYRIKKDNRKRQSQIMAEKLIEIYKSQEIDFSQQEWPSATIILLERDDDLLPVLAHSITYGALIHDLFGIENNKVSILKDNKPISYDLSPLNDQIWEESINKEYPQVTSLLDQELNTWSVKYNQITGQQEPSEQMSNLLQSALDQVPQLQQQKRLLDQHMNIAEQIMNHLKIRSLDKYYSSGINVVKQTQNYLTTCKETLAMENANNPQFNQLKELDRVRLLMMILITLPQYDEYIRLEKIANIQNENYLKAIKYLKQKIGFGDQQGKQSQQQSDFRSLFSSLATKVKNHGKGILKLVAGEKKYDIIELLEDLSDENKSYNLQEFFKIYDCRTQKETNFENFQISQTQNIICYFLDGACLNEYAELCEYSKQINQNLIYGSSEIMNASTLIKYFQMSYDEQNKQQKK